MEFVKRRCSQKIRKETGLALRQAGFCPPTAELGLVVLGIGTLLYRRRLAQG